MLGNWTWNGSLHIKIPVVSLSAPPLHGKPSNGEASSPSQSLFPWKWRGTERLRVLKATWIYKATRANGWQVAEGHYQLKNTIKKCIKLYKSWCNVLIFPSFNLRRMRIISFINQIHTTQENEEFSLWNVMWYNVMLFKKGFTVTKTHLLSCIKLGWHVTAFHAHAPNSIKIQHGIF